MPLPFSFPKPAMLSMAGMLCYLTFAQTVPTGLKGSVMDKKNIKIAYLHHSTGKIIWEGGVQPFIEEWNRKHGTHYEIKAMYYPNCLGGHLFLGKLLPGSVFSKLFKNLYPWDNYPYDYWNLWVAHQGKKRDREEWTLDDLVGSYDVIVFKHCYPISRIEPDDGKPDVASPKKTVANYKLQYEALKQRMKQFPEKRFILWTAPALTQSNTNPETAERAKQFTEWVKTTWDEKGDNIFLWDFRHLETENGLYLKANYEQSPGNSHPNGALGALAAPLLGRRIVDVIEGRGDEIR